MDGIYRSSEGNRGALYRGHSQATQTDDGPGFGGASYGTAMGTPRNTMAGAFGNELYVPPSADTAHQDAFLQPSFPSAGGTHVVMQQTQFPLGSVPHDASQATVSTMGLPNTGGNHGLPVQLEGEVVSGPSRENNTILSRLSGLTSQLVHSLNPFRGEESRSEPMSPLNHLPLREQTISKKPKEFFSDADVLANDSTAMQPSGNSDPSHSIGGQSILDRSAYQMESADQRYISNRGAFHQGSLTDMQGAYPAASEACAPHGSLTNQASPPFGRDCGSRNRNHELQNQGLGPPSVGPVPGREIRGVSFYGQGGQSVVGSATMALKENAFSPALSSPQGPLTSAESPGFLSPGSDNLLPGNHDGMASTEAKFKEASEKEFAALESDRNKLFSLESIIEKTTASDLSPGVKLYNGLDTMCPKADVPPPNVEQPVEIAVGDVQTVRHGLAGHATTNDSSTFSLSVKPSQGDASNVSAHMTNEQPNVTALKKGSVEGFEKMKADQAEACNERRSRMLSAQDTTSSPGDCRLQTAALVNNGSLSPPSQGSPGPCSRSFDAAAAEKERKRLQESFAERIAASEAALQESIAAAEANHTSIQASLEASQSQLASSKREIAQLHKITRTQTTAMDETGVQSQTGPTRQGSRCSPRASAKASRSRISHVARVEAISNQNWENEIRLGCSPGYSKEVTSPSPAVDTASSKSTAGKDQPNTALSRHSTPDKGTSASRGSIRKAVEAAKPSNRKHTRPGEKDRDYDARPAITLADTGSTKSEMGVENGSLTRASSSTANVEEVELCTRKRTRAEAIGNCYMKDGKPLLLCEQDSSETYVEELAFLYHDPIAPMKDEEIVLLTSPGNLEEEVESLPPLPPAPPVPDLPTNSSTKWRFCEESRVVYADFRGTKEITLGDRLFLARLMQRDDITVISEGLIGQFNENLWDLEFLEKAIGSNTYHKFRRFDRLLQPDGSVVYREVGGFLSMKISDFFVYLERRERAFLTSCGQEERSFTFKDAKNCTYTVDVAKVAIYMIDYDLPKHLPELYRDYKDNFKIKEALPGGQWCMMNKIPECGRPFMGPNLYIAPGGGYTHLHQDGHGTVDSGHSVLSGYNEVVMLRRMPERHKRNACQMVPRLFPEESTTYDALYEMPHADEQGERPAWPDCNTVSQWKQMNYYPSVFILKPGQHVHINKGRLHAFRKLLLDELPEHDCHAILRTDLIAEEKLEQPPLCISVAFDWMYQGFDAEGINREVAAVVECATLCRHNHRQSLAIPESAILRMAQRSCPVEGTKTSEGPAVTGETMLPFVGTRSPGRNSSCPTNFDICRGILASLRHVVQKDIAAFESSRRRAEAPIMNPRRCEKVSMAKRPDADENPQTVSADPDGDYFCKLCHHELANCYMRCDGCEHFLAKDFNICLDCHSEQDPLYARFIVMNMGANRRKRHSTINHTGDMKFNRKKPCPCKNGPDCTECGFCLGCSCRCHTWFTMRSRFMSGDEEENLLRRVEQFVGGGEVRYGRETSARLTVALDRHGEGYKAKMELLQNHPRNSLAHSSRDVRGPVITESDESSHTERQLSCDGQVPGRTHTSSTTSNKVRSFGHGQSSRKRKARVHTIHGSTGLQRAASAGNDSEDSASFEDREKQNRRKHHRQKSHSQERPLSTRVYEFVDARQNRAESLSGPCSPLGAIGIPDVAVKSRRRVPSGQAKKTVVEDVEKGDIPRICDSTQYEQREGGDNALAAG